jgi:hypothetical protein
MEKMRHRSLYCNKKIWLCLIGLMIVFPADKLWASYTQQECMDCHKLDSGKSGRCNDIEKFAASAHGGKVSCGECHTGIKDERHETTGGLGAVDCNACHIQENHHGQHAQSNKPRCQSCHTRHNILGKNNKGSSIHPDHLKQTCGKCHPRQSGDTGYLSWLPSVRIKSHPKQDFSRDYSENNCIGCHQGSAAHGETRPVDDQDCCRCHISPQGDSLLYGYIHPQADAKKQPAVFAAAMVYQLCLAFLVWWGFRFFFKNRLKKKK